MHILKSSWILLLLSCTVVLAAQESDKYLKQLQQDSFLLYFAVPIELKAAESRAELVPDFTYHDYDGGTQRDKVIMNFSLISREPVKAVDSLLLLAEGKTVESVRPTTLYIEKDKRHWNTRFTVDLTAPAYLAILRHASTAEFRIFHQEQQYVFPTNKKWRKAAEVIVEIFTLN